MHTVRLPSGHEISDDRARLDMDYVVASLGKTYWAHDRPRALLERSWANCLPIGLYAPPGHQGGRQQGFARILTDYALRAHLGDVFLDPSIRGQGLGKTLIATILAHPDLTTVGNWTLTTRDAHGLYTQYGFTPGQDDGHWMILNKPN